MARYLLCVILFAANVFAITGNDAWVAGRYDTDHVVFLTDRPDEGGPESFQNAIPNPAATLFTGFYAITPDQAKKLNRKPLSVNVGDTFTLLTEGGSSATVKVERLAVLSACGAPWIGAIAKVTDGADGFAKLRNKYYVVRKGKAAPAVADASTLVPGRLTLSAEDKSKLEAVLTAKMLAELPKVQKAASENPEYRKQWGAIDSKLARKEAALVTDVQTLKLAGGRVRYFVKAFWTADKKPAFALTLFMTPQWEIDWSSFAESDRMRLVEFGGGDSFSMANLPLLLNVIDVEGAPHFLLFIQGFEDFVITLYRYGAKGPEATEVSYEQGC